MFTFLSKNLSLLIADKYNEYIQMLTY